MSPLEAKLKRLKLNSIIFNALKLILPLVCVSETDDIWCEALFTVCIIPLYIVDLFVSIRASAGKSLRYFQIRAVFSFFGLFISSLGLCCSVFDIFDIEEFSYIFWFFLVFIALHMIFLNLAALKKYKELMPPSENKQQPTSLRRELRPIDAIITFALWGCFCMLFHSAMYNITYKPESTLAVIVATTIHAVCYILILMVDSNSKKIPRDKAAAVTYGSLAVTSLMSCLILLLPLPYGFSSSFIATYIPILLFALRFGYLQKLQKKSKTIPDNNNSSQSSFASIQDDSSKTEN